MAKLKHELLENYLKTFSPREEKILRLKFGINCHRMTDKQIIDDVARYSKYFNASQLRRHYDTLAIAHLSKDRKSFAIVFNFKSVEILFGSIDEQSQFELINAINDVF